MEPVELTLVCGTWVDDFKAGASGSGGNSSGKVRTDDFESERGIGAVVLVDLPVVFDAGSPITLSVIDRDSGGVDLDDEG